MLRESTPESWGPPPPANHKEMEQAGLSAVLKDPESARFAWGEVTRDIIPNSTFGTEPVRVWLSPLTVNAKNSFGGYNGPRPYTFAWRNGQIFAGLNQIDGQAIAFWEYAPAATSSTQGVGAQAK